MRADDLRRIAREEHEGRERARDRVQRWRRVNYRDQQKRRKRDAGRRRGTR